MVLLAFQKLQKICCRAGCNLNSYRLGHGLSRTTIRCEPQQFAAISTDTPRNAKAHRPSEAHERNRHATSHPVWQGMGCKRAYGESRPKGWATREARVHVRGAVGWQVRPSIPAIPPAFDGLCRAGPCFHEAESVVKLAAEHCLNT